MPISEPMLEIRDLRVAYGAVQAIESISFSIQPGERVALVGANGAGKSSLLRTLSGLPMAATGAATFKSRDILTASPRELVSEGMAHVPEGRRILGPLSVRDNLLLAAGAAGRMPKDEIAECMAQLFEIFPVLGERSNQSAGLLSGGEQQMLALGRAVVAAPDLLLLDEPSMGLAPKIVTEIFRILDGGIDLLADTAVLLSEQNAAKAVAFADRVIVLAHGEIVKDEEAAKVNLTEVVDAYLG